ncbi:MAG: hypothetical protein ACXVEF_00535 [Polyangiales bacterium]
MIAILLLAALPVVDRILPIPAREQAKESPPSGWCGETAIQEGLLHLGVWAPQSFIHRAGKSKHPDLYSQDIPVALTALGVRYTVYAPATKAGFPEYSAWATDAVDHGDPVLAGLKILPTEHPEWGLDHFVLIVGHGAKGLLVNTTWGTRRWVTDSTTPGFSFAKAFYAIRLRGLNGTEHPARIAIVDEKLMKVRVTCVDLPPGTAHRLERRKTGLEPKPEWSESSSNIEHTVTLDPNEPARFACVPSSS